MNILEVDISLLNFKEIKELASQINVSESYSDDNFNKVVELLLNDNRKNVKALGNKLVKDADKILKEIDRVKKMYAFDKSFGNFKYIAGVDEVGRGPLAGPIVSCAVILDLDVLEDDLILELNDSKKINEKKREELAEIIKEKALAYNISLRTAKEIDEKGIGVCNNEVFLEACNGLKIIPDLVLSDGYKVKGIDKPNESVIKGDTKSACIAAASIIAKVYRDKLMKEYSEKYPYYSLSENVGYGTVKHVEGIHKYGPCEIHRLSFLRNILSN